MAGRRLYDLTTLVIWPGNRTGVPRVIRELAERAIDDPDTVFVYWTAHLGTFREVDPRVVLDSYGADDAFVRDESPRIRRARLTKFYGAGVASNLLIRLGAAGSLARRLALYRESEFVPVVPRADDVLLCFQGLWGNSAYIETLRRLHADGVAIVQMFYDMLPLVTPQWSGHSTAIFDEWVRATFPFTALVLSDSQHTTGDIGAWCGAHGVPLPRIETIRLGDGFTVRQAGDRGNLPDGVGERPFALTVSTIEGRKNHALLYYAYRLADERGIELPELVVVGKPWYRGWDIYRTMIDDPVAIRRITVLERLDDDGLAWLYEHCRFTIYPSHYEGWGLPVAESLAWGKPVITTAASSIHEIAGDLVDYVDDFSTDELLAAIVRMGDDAYLATATARARRYEPTSWDETFASVVRAVDSIPAAGAGG